LTRLLRGLLELAIPRSCADCWTPLARREATLCDDCAARLPWLDALTCVRCQQVGVLDAPSVCRACADAESPLQACIAASLYAGDTESWIRRFKYPSRGLGGLDPRPAAVVRELARYAVELAPGRPDRVVPIPLHRGRLVERGFNPAALIAREVARHSAARFDPRALRRTRATPSQTGLGRRERRRNVADAFEALRPLHGCIWLVDDVVTTGSTLEEAARALRHAGASEVAAICVARTPAPE